MKITFVVSNPIIMVMFSLHSFRLYWYTDNFIGTPTFIIPHSRVICKGEFGYKRFLPLPALYTIYRSANV